MENPTLGKVDNTLHPFQKFYGVAAFFLASFFSQRIVKDHQTNKTQKKVTPYLFSITKHLQCAYSPSGEMEMIVTYRFITTYSLVEQAEGNMR